MVCRFSVNASFLLFCHSRFFVAQMPVNGFEDMSNRKAVMQMNVRKRWKPGGRRRQRSSSEKWLEERKKDLSGGQREQLIVGPALVPRKSRKEE
ncbi:hypothetical protein [Caproicibacter sp. BJN0012]|uniref:hypothetical protein n=1 Tax=Caproicibacter sp. BJN0012 TaxID=3110227 RepID=UPI002E11D659